MARTKTSRVKPTLVGGLDYQDQFDALLASQPENSVRVLMTPVLAQYILDKYNQRNRSLSPRNVLKLSRAFAEGRWVDTRVPVIFSEDGLLVDGQHRLQALIARKMQVPMDIMFGADADAFAVMDRGKIRSSSDVLSIEDIPNSIKVASTVKWIHLYDTGALGQSGMRSRDLEPDQVRALYPTMPGIQESIRRAEGLRHRKLVTGTVAGAMHYICARLNRDEADHFFDCLGTGFGYSHERAPGLALRNMLIENAAVSGDKRLQPTRVGAYIIKAWNAQRQGRHLGLFRFSKTESFPKAI